MTTIFSKLVAGLAIAAGQSGGELTTAHVADTKYNQIDYEAACGSTVFRVRFRNGPDEFGRVDRLSVGGRSIPGAAAQLQLRAARRAIDRIGIMNCGLDEERPVFRGVMELSREESRVAAMRASLYFRITRQGRGRWQFAFD